MHTRLPIDGALQAYWGFDEANTADVAVDETGQGNDLIVHDAAAVVPARIGNGRQFDGALTYAAPADSSIFRIGLNCFIAWVILDSVNQVGDQLRPIITLEGPGVGANDATDFGLYVDNDGAVVLRLTASGNLPCLLKTAPGLIRVNRYYSMAVTVALAQGPPVGLNGIVALLWLNNVAVPWASFTVNGVPQADPNAEGPIRAACGGTTVITVGGAKKTTSKWHGVLDEMSIHSAVRAFDPYLKAAYFRLTLAQTFTRLTTLGTVKVLAATDMGGGTRWWCYERDQSIYVIRENSLGLFSPEVQLTGSPTLTGGAIMPGGVGQPRLAYDAVSDVLVVAFIGAGRVYKVTALSSDAPTSLVMPLTADVGGVIKASDNRDAFRIGASAGPGSERMQQAAVLQDLLPATIAFLPIPSFGVRVTGTYQWGYAVFQIVGAAEVLLGYARGPTQTARVEAPGYWHVPVVSRLAGASYKAYPITRDGRVLPGPESNILTDWLGEMVGNVRLPAEWSPDALVWNQHGDADRELGDFSAGEAHLFSKAWGINTLYPLKALILDAFASGAAGGHDGIRWRLAGTAPLKVLLLEGIAVSAGESTSLTMQVSPWRVSL